MESEYRFVRTKNGVTSFAIVGVSSNPNKSWLVRWKTSILEFEKIYGNAVKAGVMLAAREHEKHGGQSQLVEIAKLVETPVDTREDAVTCAAALASWKSWGHSADEISVIFEGGSWKVVFTEIT